VAYYCTFVESELLLFCVTTDVYFICHFWRWLACRLFYTASFWHFLAQKRQTILQYMMETYQIIESIFTILLEVQNWPRLRLKDPMFVTWQNWSPMTLPIRNGRLRAMMMMAKALEEIKPFPWSILTNNSIRRPVVLNPGEKKVWPPLI